MVKRLGFVVGCTVIAVVHLAHAQVDNSGVLDHALKQYRSAAETWQSAAQGAATTLFWSLATISLVWTMGQLALRRADLGEFFAELIRFLLFTGFWAWMLANGPAHAQLIIDSMNRLASTASGQGRITSPSGIVDIGFHIFDRVLTQSTIMSPLDSALGIVLALVILVVLALVAVNMLVTLVACWIVAYGGLIVLGFGGSRWTNDIAMNYYRMMLSLGLQVLAMVLIVGIGESFVRSYYDALKQDVSLHEQAVLLVVSIVLLAMVNRVPPLLGTLANGSTSPLALGSGAAAGAALSAMSATGALAAATTRSALDGAGQLMKAAAVTAAAGGAGTAIASMIDAFRAGDRGGSSGGQRETSGRVEGSLFAAPASGTAAPATTFASPAVGASREPPPTEALLERGPQERPEAELRAAAEEGAGERSATPQTEAELASNDNEHDRESSELEAPKRSMPTLGAGAGPRGDEATETYDRSVEDDASPSGSEATSRQSVPARRVAAGEGGKSAAADFAGKNTSHDSSSPVSSGPRSSDASPPATTVSSSVAGTFTSAVPNGAMTRDAAPVPSSAARCAGTAPQPSWTTTAHVGSGAPPNALAGAITRAAAMPQDVSFTTPNETIATNGQKSVQASATVETAARAELPTAYSMQTAVVDVEAEVAAFRDKE